jgi:hypothetical protein
MAEAIDYFLIQNLLNRYSDAVDRGDFNAVWEMFRHVRLPTRHAPALPVSFSGICIPPSVRFERR